MDVRKILFFWGGGSIVNPKPVGSATFFLDPDYLFRIRNLAKNKIPVPVTDK